MNPLQGRQDKLNTPVSDEEMNGTSAGSPSEEARSDEGRYSDRPAGDHQKAEGAFRQALSEQRSSHHEERRGMYSAEVRDRDEAGVDQVREMRFEECHVNPDYEHQSRVHWVPERSLSSSINLYINESKSFKTLREIYEFYQDSLDHVNMVAVCRRLIELEPKRDWDLTVFLAKFSLQVEREISRFSAQDLATIAFAFGKGGRKVRRLFEAIGREALQKTREFNAQDIVKISWSFSEQGCLAQELFDALAEEALQKIQDFSVHDIATAAWAFGMNSPRNKQMLIALGNAARDKIRRFNAQDIWSMYEGFLWGGLRDTELFHVLAIQASRRVREFDREKLGRMIHTFQRLGMDPEEWRVLIEYRDGNIRPLQTPSVEK